MIYLDKEQIKRIHKIMIEKTGGADGIRDEGLLDSALANPFQTFDNQELYPGMVAKIARIAYGLVKNHPFVDGNKRLGMYVMLILLEINNFVANFNDDDIIKIGMDLASGAMTDAQLLEIILHHCE